MNNNYLPSPRQILQDERRNLHFRPRAFFRVLWNIASVDTAYCGRLAYKLSIYSLKLESSRNVLEFSCEHKAVVWLHIVCTLFSLTKTNAAQFEMCSFHFAGLDFFAQNI